MQPLVLGIDIETTGLDTLNDHVTEVAWVVKRMGDPKPLVARTSFVMPPPELWDSAEYLKPSIQALTKITMAHLKTGLTLPLILDEICTDIECHGVDYVVAHNGENFDKPFLAAKTVKSEDPARFLPLFNKQWLDTSVDVVYPEDCRYTNLMYVAAYYGFVNPFPHAALFDVMTMLKVLDNHDVEEVAARARIPWVVVRAAVSYDNRELAKARRYAWENLGTEKYPKTWVKKIKECDLEKETAEAPFPVVKIA